MASLMPRGKESGFVLVGVILAVVVMGTLAATGLSLGSTTALRETEQEFQFRLVQIRRAITAHQKQFSAWPASLEVLVAGRWLRPSCLRDPVARGNWTLVKEGLGVKDVRSSSSDWGFRLIEGERKRYREW